MRALLIVHLLSADGSGIEDRRYPMGFVAHAETCEDVILDRSVSVWVADRIGAFRVINRGQITSYTVTCEQGVVGQ